MQHPPCMQRLLMLSPADTHRLLVMFLFFWGGVGWGGVGWGGVGRGGAGWGGVGWGCRVYRVQGIGFKN